MYQYYNAHPKGLLVGDCVKRSITVAAQMDYMEVQRELNRHKKVTGAKSFNSDYNPHHYVENVLRARKLSFPAVKGEKRMNGERFCKTYPKGRYILNMAGHWSCCVDGVIYDTWDCSEKCVYTAYELKPVQSEIRKNCFISTMITPSKFKITVYDKNGKSIEHVISSVLVDGYIQCLKDQGYKLIKL